MGLNQASSDDLFRDLIRHRGHKIVCTDYGGRDGSIWSVSLECETCSEVLLDADAPGVTTDSKSHIPTKKFPWHGSKKP